MISKSISLNSAYWTGLRENSARFLVTTLLALSILFPTVFQLVKAAILLVALVIILSGALINQVPLSRRLYFFSCLYAFVGLTWSFYGEIRSNPGAMSMMTVMVLYPLLIPLCTSLYRERDSGSLYRIFLICAWIIAITDLVYVLAYSTYIGDILQTFYNYLYSDWAVVDTNDVYTKFTLPNISSLIFLIPFFLSSLLFSESRKVKSHSFFIVLLTLPVAALSGRRALLVSMVVGPAIAIIITITRSHSRIKVKRASSWWWWSLIIAIAISIWIYLAVYWVGLAYYTDQINSIFDFKDNQSNLERAYQFHSMMRGIHDAPWFGHGAGAVADYIRSNEMPWAYELYYISIMFQYGIVGFVLYAVGIIFLCWKLISSVREKGRSSFEFCLLSGFIAFLIANATNPYLAKFDYMWIVFIPYAIVNLKLISGNSARSVGLSRAH